MNQYNHGQLVGTLARKPEVKELRSGAKSVRLVIRNLPDPNDGPEYMARRRTEQEVTVNVFVPVGHDSSAYESAEPGMSASCEFWVESYTYQRDGQERSGQSLNAESVSLVWSETEGGDAVEDDDPNLF